MTLPSNRLTALAVLGGGFVLFLAIILPMEIGKYQRHQTELAAAAIDNARFQALSGTQKDLEAEIASLEAAIESEPSVITASSRTAAQDQFLARVRAAVTARSGQIRSFELTEPVTVATLERMGAVVTFDVAEMQLPDLLADLEGDTARVYMRELSISATPDGSDPQASPMLSIRATVLGFARIEADS